MENTGRILRGLTPTARRILFGTVADASIETELVYISEVDRAHLVMLIECGIVDRYRGASLLQIITDLRACSFAPLRGRSAQRGLFLLYEDYLVERLGPDTGGVLQTARSRNDLNATVLRLRLRKPYLQLVREVLRLQAVLIRRAQRFASVVMPAYTHYQAAVPITYGHYLTGIALSVARHVEELLGIASDLGESPLGAGAVGGTSVPIDPVRTAELLGCTASMPNAVESIASRDFVLRLLGIMAMLAVSLSRLSNDLLVWSTAEFGFFSLPDSLVGSSSMMPQKRNPFLLEHVQGRSSGAIGAFVSAATAMHGAPFTNSIAVGTEAIRDIWRVLRELTETTMLLRLVVAGASPVQDAMLRSAVDGYTSATALADRLVMEAGMAFRTAHRLVGMMVRDAVAKDQRFIEGVAPRWLAEVPCAISLDGLDPASVVQASQYGGGPSATAVYPCLRKMRVDWTRQLHQMRCQADRWRSAGRALDEAVHEILDSLGARAGVGGH
jgi:argininosuccinate lyase